MNAILQEKLNQLEQANKFACWYLVKQPTGFDVLCYLVANLETYQKNISNTHNLADFISQNAVAQKQLNPSFDFSSNYRALRVAVFFGLIKMTSTTYVDAEISPVFDEIKQRCAGQFENTALYLDIIQRQIEKMFISSEFDEEHEGTRSEFRLYPVMLLYKVLLELGRSTGEYKVTINEYRYLIATTQKFEDFLDTLILINLARKDSDNINSLMEKFREKFDNRIIQALKQLPTLDIQNDSISLVKNKIDEVALKVYAFEQNPELFHTDHYIDFLCSNRSLFQLPHIRSALLEDIDRPANIPNATSFNHDTKKGDNILLYGVPGVGKSHLIKTQYCDDMTKMERVVFHPDYMNTDFIGQILPITKNNPDGTGKYITYEFIAGAFTRILQKAVNDKSNHYYLIIEELNRGNAPAIFGEVFQLLDRDDNGVSDYAISHPQVAEIVYSKIDEPIRIPANLTLIATMNTADQNVFTLDTAFQRRWQMQMISNDIEQCEFKDIEILDTEIRWEVFNNVINQQILDNSQSLMSSEDKRLGAYFISKEVLDQDTSTLHQHNLFAEKVLKYLWDDVFKLNRDSLFATNYKSLDTVVKDFSTNTGIARFNVLNTDIIALLENQNKGSN